MTWLAENLEMQERATAAGAMLLVLAAGLDVQAIESRVKMLRQTAGEEDLWGGSQCAVAGAC